MNVFKFGTADGIMGVLKSGTIWVTSPLDLNDPFEMRPAWTNAHEERRREHETRLNEQMRGKPLMGAFKEGLRKIGDFPDLSPGPTVDVEHQYGISDLYNGSVFRELQDRFRVLSFVSDLFDVTEKFSDSNPEATLMWSHYADSFQGACLVIDSTKIENGIKVGGFGVEYDKPRQAFPPVYYDTLFRERIEIDGLGFSAVGEKGILVPDFRREEAEQRHFIDLLTCKSPAWRYENEVRFLYELGQLRKSDSYVPQTHPCRKCTDKSGSPDECSRPVFHDSIKLPPDAVVAVVFGVDIHPEDLDSILKLLEKEEYADTRKFWSSLHSESYCVRYSLQNDTYLQDMQRVRNRNFNTAKNHFIPEKGEEQYVPLKKGSTLDVTKARAFAERKEREARDHDTA